MNITCANVSKFFFLVTREKKEKETKQLNYSRTKATPCTSARRGEASSIGGV
jgi:hypothetical protein